MNKNTEKAECHTFDGGISAEQLEQWKNKYRKVVRIDVTDEGDLHVGYFRRPSMETMKAVSQVGKNDEMKAAEILFDNCWLGGSGDLRTEALLFVEVQKQLGVMLSSCRSSLKNL